MSAPPAALLDTKARVLERLRDDPRLVGVGVGKVNGRLGIVVYGTMDALDFTCVGDVPVALRRAAPPVPQAAAPVRVNGVALALGIVGIGAVASLVSRAGSGNADARRDPQVDTPAFRAWFKNSRVVDPDNGRPRVVYHGTTHDFDAFDLKNANVENHHGRAFYFTTEREDVGSNYATREGPGLTSRVENAMDNLSSADDQDELIDAWAKAHPGRKKDAATLRRAMTNGTVSTYQSIGYNLMREVWRWHAERRLVGSHGGAVLPVYLSIQNPVDLRSNWQAARAGRATGGTYFGIDTKWVREGRPDEEARQTGLGVKAQKAIREVAARYWDRDLAEEILGKLDTYEGFSARDLESAVRGMGSDWMSDDGDPSGPGEFLRQVYERMGFDGIVEDAYLAFGGARQHGKSMAGVEPGTEHWVAFKPSQVKSAVGNRGTFSARSPKLSANRGSTAKRAPAKKPAPRYVMLPRGGNGSGITRFLPDEHVLGRKIDWVNPESLEIDPLDTERDPERLKSVLQGMRDGLPLPALIVYEGEQTIWDGHHRQMAALKLKLPLVPVQWLRYEPGDA